MLKKLMWIPESVEAAWAILTPKHSDIKDVQKILVGGVYIAPRTDYKQPRYL